MSDELIKRMIPLAQKIAKRRTYSARQYEIDILSSAMYGLFVAVRALEKKPHPNPTAFICKKIGWEITSFLRTVKVTHSLEGRDVGVTDNFNINDELEQFNPLEREIIKSRMAGLTLREISEQTKIPLSTIQRKLKKAGEKYEA